jgi:nucleoside-diphosphate-sugar epimerase
MGAATSKAQGARSRIAVLGGTGFVGKAVSRTLLDLGYEVLAIARTPRDVAAGAAFSSLDLAKADHSELSGILAAAKTEAVVNAAGGMWGLTESEMVEANVTLVDKLVKAVAPLPLRPRLIQLGSVHEYGLVPVGSSMDENLVPQPVVPYGKLKLECANVVLDAARRGDVDGVVLRIGNVVGAGQPGHSLLGIIATQLIEARDGSRAAELKTGSLGSQRDFLALADAADAIGAAVNASGASGEVVNIGTGSAHSARQLVRMLIDVSGVPATLTEADPPSAVEDDWQQMGIAKARDVLGWVPRRTLDDAVREVWSAVADPEK